MVQATVAAALAVAWLLAPAKAQDGPAPALNCEIGPVTHTFGGTEWLVHSCEDEKTLVFASAPGSPAIPFYFILFPEAGGYRLYGEGTGDRDATQAAMAELSAITEHGIRALIDETRSRPGGKK